MNIKLIRSKLLKNESLKLKYWLCILCFLENIFHYKRNKCVANHRAFGNPIEEKFELEVLWNLIKLGENIFGSSPRKFRPTLLQKRGQFTMPSTLLGRHNQWGWRREMSVWGNLSVKGRLRLHKGRRNTKLFGKTLIHIKIRKKLQSEL